MLLEGRMMDRCDEISEISYALLEFVGGKRKINHEHRLHELRLEMQQLWKEYRRRVRTNTVDVQF